MTEATHRLPHMKIILQRRSYGWAAWFYGGDMPEDVELPLPLTSSAAEAQGLPYILVPRVLSREEWIERYSPRLDEEGELHLLEPIIR